MQDRRLVLPPWLEVHKIDGGRIADTAIACLTLIRFRHILTGAGAKAGRVKS